MRISTEVTSLEEANLLAEVLKRGVITREHAAGLIHTTEAEVTQYLRDVATLKAMYQRFFGAEIDSDD